MVTDVKHGTCVLLQNGIGEYLMQFRDGNPDIHDPLMWDFFGGGCDEGEDVIACSIREIEEELELQMISDQLTAFADIQIEDVIHHVVRSSLVVEWGDFRVREGAGCAFFTLDEMKRIPVVPYIRQVIEMIETR